MRALDFDGNPKEPFEIKAGWDHGTQDSKAKPGQVDANGVYQPEDDGANAIMSFPGISTGLALEVYPEAKVTPTIGLEAFRVKTPIPYFRWWVFQVEGGAQMVDVYAGKLLVPVVDVTVGPWFGWDFDKHATAWGAAFTIFKF